MTRQRLTVAIATCAIAVASCDTVPGASGAGDHCEDRQVAVEAAWDAAEGGETMAGADRVAYIVLTSPDCFDSDQLVAAREMQRVLCESRPQEPGEPSWIYQERLEAEQRERRSLLSCDL